MSSSSSLRRARKTGLGLVAFGATSLVLGLFAPIAGAAPNSNANENAITATSGAGNGNAGGNGNGGGSDHAAGNGNAGGAATGGPAAGSGGDTQGRSGSNPDGGGVDKPYAADGQPAMSQGSSDWDGNNGCGNDDDREDDNNGNCGGGHKKTRAKSKDTATETETRTETRTESEKASALTSERSSAGSTGSSGTAGTPVSQSVAPAQGSAALAGASAQGTPAPVAPVAVRGATFSRSSTGRASVAGVHTVRQPAVRGFATPAAPQVQVLGVTFDRSEAQPLAFAYTGASDINKLLALVGLAMVLGGVILMVVTRRNALATA
ncbi:MAG TPA: hypothetical protein VM030_04780 [Acidimicrobiales bacterium]|nr:hypothetical protein [Acidimicrobiales bacterium]